MEYYRRKSQRLKDSKVEWPQGQTFKNKSCRNCKETFKPTAPAMLYCSESCEARGYTNAYLKRNYGVTLDWYEEKWNEQNGLCCICLRGGFLMDPKRHRTKLVVDHCHSTGKVRGLLCHNCNRALGLLKDDLESVNRVKVYLEGATTIESTPKGGSE